MPKQMQFALAEEGPPLLARVLARLSGEQLQLSPDGEEGQGESSLELQELLDAAVTVEGEIVRALEQLVSSSTSRVHDPRLTSNSAICCLSKSLSCCCPRWVSFPVLCHRPVAAGLISLSEFNSKNRVRNTVCAFLCFRWRLGTVHL